jgi:hypothetical protein
MSIIGFALVFAGYCFAAATVAFCLVVMMLLGVAVTAFCRGLLAGSGQ